MHWVCMPDRKMSVFGSFSVSFQPWVPIGYSNSLTTLTYVASVVNITTVTTVTTIS